MATVRHRRSSYIGVSRPRATRIARRLWQQRRNGKLSGGRGVCAELCSSRFVVREHRINQSLSYNQSNGITALRRYDDTAFGACAFALGEPVHHRYHAWAQ